MESNYYFQQLRGPNFTQMCMIPILCHVTFGLAFSPLNSATLRCSSVVTLRYLHYYYVYICNNNFDFPSGLQVTMRKKRAIRFGLDVFDSTLYSDAGR